MVLFCLYVCLHVCLYLRLVPVEADAPVVFERSHVALVLGEVRPLVENHLRLGLVNRHRVDYFAHSVLQQLPNLERDRQTDGKTRFKYLLLCLIETLSFCIITELEDIWA